MLYSDKYPFLAKYFESGLKSDTRSISHSILFFGNDLEAQYELAFEVARLLNCKEGRADDCECLNCNWIRSHQHPAVLVYSRSDNKEADDSKTVISVRQALAVRSLLMNTSDYHRIFIFCDKDAEGNVCGLNRQNFQEEASNALLKIIEEPPANTTFFFLTRDKEDLIETIVSRSQSFFVPSGEGETHEFNSVKDTIENYFEISKTEFQEFAQRIFTLAKLEGADKILQEIQNYILSILKANADNAILSKRFRKNIEAVEKAKREIALKMDLQNVLEDLALKLLTN